MAKTKYPVSNESFPLNRFAPPMSQRFVRLTQKAMKTPKFLWKDPQPEVQSRIIPGYQGDEMEVFLLTPENLPEPAPCLVHLHGCGFVFEGSASHFRLAMTYAKEARCKVVFVRYRLAPKHPFPVPQEDCYAALCWVYDHADELAIDRHRIGITGDSAGGTLYAQLLKEAGIQVEFHEVKGTMHGFDTVFHAPTTQKMIACRITYIKRMFMERA